MEAGWTPVPCPATNLWILIQYVNHLQGQSVISVALKTPLEIRLGICIYKTSLLHRPDDYIGLTPSCPSHSLQQNCAHGYGRYWDHNNVVQNYFVDKTTTESQSLLAQKTSRAACARRHVNENAQIPRRLWTCHLCIANTVVRYHGNQKRIRKLITCQTFLTRNKETVLLYQSHLLFVQ